VADTYDLLTLQEAKSALRIDATDTYSDTLLAASITAISRRLDRAIGPSVVRSVSGEIHDGGHPRIELRYGPVQAVGTVWEYQTTSLQVLTENTAAVNPTDGWYGERYVPDASLYSGIILRTVSGFPTRFWSGVGNVVCTYTAGRSTSTGAVDVRIKEGARLALRNWWRQYEQSVAGFEEFDVPRATFPTYALPRACCELLHDLWQQEVGFGGSG
jgi:hypothetical protein